MKFTENQIKAINKGKGNTLVVASAGSGKTSCFTNRIQYLIDKENAEPSSIMAVTFTKKASEEMRSRLEGQIGKVQASEVMMGTFHSIALKILKSAESSISGKTIMPDWWRYSTLNDICRPFDIDKNPNGLNLGMTGAELSYVISNQKANMVFAGEELYTPQEKHAVIKGDLSKAYEKFEEIKAKAKYIDFDDILLALYKKLLGSQEFRSELRDRFEYIMIDEFQDSSKIMLEIVRLMNGDNVYVVGDFRQSIYSFINASVENMLHFKDIFESVDVIELTDNFRSSKKIVEFSNRIVCSSPIEEYSDFKESESTGEDGSNVSLTCYMNEEKQAQDIATSILNSNQDGTPLKENAILVRTNSQTAVLEYVLSEMDIPYEVTRTRSFFDRNEVIDIISYGILALNNDDDECFRRIYNTPNRYFSKKFLHELEDISHRDDISLLSAIDKHYKRDSWGVNKAMTGLNNVLDSTRKLIKSNDNAGRVLQNIVKKTDYLAHVEEKAQTPSVLTEKTQVIDKLCEMASKFPTFEVFLINIDKIKEKQSKSKGKDAVNITTVHSSKGLEWDNVYVIDCNDEMFPHQMNPNTEEERRLFYVACSRPRKNLNLSWRALGEEMNTSPVSRFLKDVVGSGTIKRMTRGVFNNVSQKYKENVKFN